jgi:hypothetical protein
MQELSGPSVVEGLLIDRIPVWADVEVGMSVEALTDRRVAAELEVMQSAQARQVAREAELILRLADLRPDTDDPPAGVRGGRSRTWRTTDPEFPGVSEFFLPEVAHLLNVGRRTAAFRARRAFTWRDNLPATFALLGRGDLDERRAGVLADVLGNTTPDLARGVEARVLPEARDLSVAALKSRALELLAELDAEAVRQRHEEAKQAADVRRYETGDGMAALTVDLPAEQAAACMAVINRLAEMAKADGDERPIGAIRAEIAGMLLLRPADTAAGGITVHLHVTAGLDSLEGSSGEGGEVNGATITAAQLRDLLRRVGALGLTAPTDGDLSFSLTDQHGRLLATLTEGELQRLAAKGCPQHPDGGCACPVAGMPADTDAYSPTAAQQRFLTTRDRRCLHPNCGQRAGWADHDHVLPHAQGGKTSCTNLCCLCRSHHRLKTFAPGWAFRIDPDGTLHVTSPSGVTRTSRPPGLRPPAPRQPPPGPEPPPDDPPPF